MDANSIAIQIAMINTRNPANLSAADLESLIAKSEVALDNLRDVYRIANGDDSLTARCFTAAKAIERLQYGLKGRWEHLTGNVP
jgi:hypothetical protein